MKKMFVLSSVLLLLSLSIVAAIEISSGRTDGRREIDEKTEYRLYEVNDTDEVIYSFEMKNKQEITGVEMINAAVEHDKQLLERERIREINITRTR